MKISNIEVFKFKTWTRNHPSKWGYRQWGKEIESSESITKISTDEGIDGYMLGGTRNYIEGSVKRMLLGEDPLEREKLWNWMDQLVTFGLNSLPEREMGVVDCALWDLFGRMVGLPVSTILGGARKKVKAYASTFPNMGRPEDYAAHAKICKDQGYKAYKVHAYICWNPHTWEPAPQVPGFPKEDVEVCAAVREAVGDDMVLMLDPFGVYTLEQSLWVGRELQKLGYYWLEHPMVETRIEAYRRLTNELDIAVLSPEHVPGGVFSRAEWVIQGASDMLRIDHNYGGITGSLKLVNVAQAYGIQCEMHGGGCANSQILGATTEATCEYFERGLLRPDFDYETPPPYLNSIVDPLDDKGNVILSQQPGLGLDLNWDYINDNLIKES
ncbi:MAG: D-galactarolactone cycloisomerase [Candidatus Moanabacter tarae]|uniref:D-galactarolactone cycloisomerase n=1 Tax=Candidatus Moanibacter tarae TaxID=2200854 RepID=A0A2Z4AIW9_9BACT|nr:MAG: D-galactarolactone cycloisomerase [Candidatus Moanabacter tarae]|tara:strand:- start:3472 stop:4623 length:1152 start_codon:yes stop_codon:yes gene_type:complete